MRSRKRLSLIASVVAVVAMVVAGVLLASRDDDSGQPSGVQVGLGPGALEARRGPPIPDIGGTNPVTGEQLSVADFRGKPLVVNVWASWCPPCREEAPDIKRFADAHPEAVMLGIDFQDTAEEARAFYGEFEWSHPSIFDPDGRLAAKLGLVGLPTTVFYDSQHREVARVVGEVDFAGLEEGLALAKGGG